MQTDFHHLIRPTAQQRGLTLIVLASVMAMASPASLAASKSSASGKKAKSTMSSASKAAKSPAASKNSKPSKARMAAIESKVLDLQLEVVAIAESKKIDPKRLAEIEREARELQRELGGGTGKSAPSGGEMGAPKGLLLTKGTTDIGATAGTTPAFGAGVPLTLPPTVPVEARWGALAPQNHIIDAGNTAGTTPAIGSKVKKDEPTSVAADPRAQWGFPPAGGATIDAAIAQSTPNYLPAYSGPPLLQVLGRAALDEVDIEKEITKMSAETLLRVAAQQVLEVSRPVARVIGKSAGSVVTLFWASTALAPNTYTAAAINADLNRRNAEMVERQSWGRCALEFEVVVCVENSSPGIALEFDAPADADWLRFDVDWGSPTGMDVFSVWLDGKQVALLSGGSQDIEMWVPIGAPGRHQLGLQLVGNSIIDADFRAGNFGFTNDAPATASPVPEPPMLAVFGLALAVLAAVSRSRRVERGGP